MSCFLIFLDYKNLDYMGSIVYKAPAVHRVGKGLDHNGFIVRNFTLHFWKSYFPLFESMTKTLHIASKLPFQSWILIKLETVLFLLTLLLKF